MTDNISITEAARLIGITREKLIALCRAGYIRAKRTGNEWNIDAKSAREYSVLTASSVTLKKGDVE